MNGLELVASWLTPTVLFCVLNLVIIGIIIINSTLKPQQNLGDNKDDEQPPQLVRVPSFLERVKSINLSRYGQSQQQPNPPADYAVPAQQQETADDRRESDDGPHQVTRSKSDTVKNETPARRVLKKSASEKVSSRDKREKQVDVDQGRPATVREKTARFGGEDEAVDAKADDFINRFRQQLKLQRLDSILRYKEMLNRGT